MKEKYDELEKENQFRPLPFWREIFLKKEKLPSYYNAKRKYLHDNGNSIKGMKWRSKLHPILLKLMELDRKFINRQTLTIIKDEHTETNKPVIYAITHMGKFDYQIVSEAIKAHQIPFAGDPETTYRTFDGALLELNGVIYCDTEDKVDRSVASDTSIELLKNGHNLLLYPEGVWNLSSNLLMLPLFPGIIRMAMNTGVDIVPVAVEQYDKDFYVNIGKNFSVEKKEFSTSDDEKKYVDEKKEELRDAMSTLKWEIFEVVPHQARAELGDYAQKNQEFVDTRLNEWFNNKEKKPFYNRELVEHRTYKVKNVSFAKNVFDFYRKMKITKNNAFLYRTHESLPDEVNEEIENRIKSR